MKKNKVKASNFLDWYFSSPDDVKAIGSRVFNTLIHNGKVNITIEDLFYECGYIPQSICENDLGDEEYCPIEVEFINNLN